MSLPFEPYDEVPRLQSAVTDAFCELARQSVDENGVFRVSLSGGSTPKRVYEMLRDRDLPWSRDSVCSGAMNAMSLTTTMIATTRW